MTEFKLIGDKIWNNTNSSVYHTIRNVTAIDTHYNVGYSTQSRVWLQIHAQLTNKLIDKLIT